MRARTSIVALLLCAALMPCLPLSALATNDPPSGGGTVTGDWTVTDQRTYSGVTINCDGNLIVTGSGSLTLDGVDLRIRSTASTIYTIEVRSGGRISLTNGTRVSNGGGSSNFRFMILSGAHARIHNATISRCGVMGAGTGRGIYIASDDVVIENSTIRDGYEGIHIEYASPKVLNTTLQGHSYYALFADHGFPSVDGCTLYSNGHYGGAPAVLVESSNSSSAVCRISNSTIAENEYGIYFNLDTPGVIENCTIRGQTYRGVWIRQSNAVLRGNNITGNREHGIFLEEASPLIENNSITWNGQTSQPAAGIYVYLTSHPVIKGNYIALNNDTGINVRAYCAPQISENHITSNTNRGIRLDHSGPARVLDNNISSNYDGVHADAVSGALLQGNRLVSNGNDGLHSQGGSTLLFEGNSVTGSGMCGIHATGQTALQVGNSTFSGGNQFGISLEGGSRALVLNCDFSDEYREAILADATSTVDWLVTGRASLDGDGAVVRGNITVGAGGSLLLRSAHVELASTASSRVAVEVGAGGEMVVEGCNLTAFDPAFNYRFASSGTLDVSNSIVEEVGWDWGTSGETAGLHIAGGSAHIRDSTLARSYCGLVVRGATATLERTSIEDCEACAADLRGGALEMRNGTIQGASQSLLRLDLSSRAEMVNTSFDQSRVSLLDGPSVLNVSWFVDAIVRWTGGEPAGGAEVVLRSAQGESVYSALAGGDGLTAPGVVQEFSQRSASKTYFTPHSATATRGSLSAERQVTINSSQTIELTLVDGTPPEIKIVSPPDGSYTNSTSLEISGCASDPESGILRVEVSWDNLTWVEASTGDGFATWSHRFQLIEMTHTLRARATNGALQRSVAQVTVTIKTRPPLLLVNSPRDGLLTNTTPLLVSGIADISAVVVVEAGGVETTAENEGGNFTVHVPLREGLNTVVVRAIDPAGNVNQTERRVFLDTIPPFIDLELPPVSYVNQQSVMVNGTTDAVQVIINGVRVAVEGGEFSRLVVLNTGPGTTNTTIEIVAQDAAGNMNRTIIYILRDMTMPPLNIDSPPSGVSVTNQTSVWLNGSTEPGTLVTLNGLPLLVDSSGYFSELVELEEGVNVLVVEARDLAGNLRRTQLTVHRDTVAPPLTVVSPADGLHTTDFAVDVLASTEPGAKAYVNGEFVTVSASGNFTRTALALTLGANLITVLVVDAAGNSESRSLTVFRDEPPTPPPPQPLQPGPRAELEFYLPYVLILIVILGGASAVGWIVASYRGAQRRAARIKGTEERGGRGGRGERGRRIPVPQDRTATGGWPRSAHDLYAKDYAARWAQEHSPQPSSWPEALPAAHTLPEAYAPSEPDAAEGAGPGLESVSWDESEEAEGAPAVPAATEAPAPGTQPAGPNSASGAAEKRVEEDISELLKRFREVGPGGGGA
ncbi:MAG: right-handed parallel beta-helix repeat-containing protein [Thermoplasmatota archaeon]